jgi:hypothetical protein
MARGAPAPGSTGATQVFPSQVTNNRFPSGVRRGALAVPGNVTSSAALAIGVPASHTFTAWPEHQARRAPFGSQSAESTSATSVGSPPLVATTRRRGREPRDSTPRDWR